MHTRGQSWAAVSHLSKSLHYRNQIQDAVDFDSFSFHVADSFQALIEFADGLSAQAAKMVR